VDAETPEGNAAVRATAGLALTYRGQVISAFFHSTCGYATATPAEAFRGIDNAPYLRSVSDRRPGGGYYCDISPRFRWSVEWDAATLRDILRRTATSVLGVSAATVDDIRDVRVEHTGRSGRAAEIRIRVGRGEIPVYAPDIRQVFLTPEGRPLGSTAVQLHPEREGDTLVWLKAAGAGWGHGVGMCQWGAVGRARAGQDFREILAAYFPGTVIERWY
jgi:stage II sporulation protein D